MSEIIQNKKNYLTAVQRRHSIRYLLSCVAVGFVGSVCISSTVISLLALKLGAGEMFLGWMTFLWLAPQVFGMITLPHIEYKGKKRVLFFWYAMCAVLAMGFMAIPFLAIYTSKFFVLAYTLIIIGAVSISGALAWTGWFPLLQDIVPARLMGRFFGNFRTGWQIAGLISTLSLAFFMGKDAPWWKFQLIFCIAASAFAIRALCILKAHENPPQKTYAQRSSIKKLLVEFIKEKANYPMIAYIATYAIAVGMCEPFKIKLLRDLGYSDSFIIYTAAMTNIGGIVSLRYWGRIADRFGNRCILSITSASMIFITLAWVFINDATANTAFANYLIFGLYFLLSIFNCGNGIVQTRFIMQTIPVSKQPQVTLVNHLMLILWGIASVIGGFALKSLEGLELNLGFTKLDNYQMLFAFVAILFTIPLAIRHNLKMDKDKTTKEVMAIMMRPLIGQLSARRYKK
ncbi:MAG: MFS transporter [Phycisphaerae bacterium]|nr:MFS transporter [Phycisphaerae bacterium]